ncbi:MAG TPA: glycosyltransferase family 2 protein [Terracidiphilus sp.]|jgi:rhamnosyltransferase
MKVALIIPTLNAAGIWERLFRGIIRQSLRPDDVIVVDSSSSDGTADLAHTAGFRVIQIARNEFSHGGTRQAAALCAPHADVLIYLTQDAFPHGAESFRHLAAAFHDPAIGAAYGRQLPRRQASAIEAHARLFNYQSTSQLRSWESRTTLGFKSIFFSNTFGAFRRDALMSVGGFPSDVNFGEDTLAVARLHRAGWKTAYVAEALVEHSHAFSIRAEFRRYLEIGVLHERERWLIEEFGAADDEGWRFVASELRYLSRSAPLHIPAAILRTLTKYIAYRSGRLRGSAEQPAKRKLAA